MHETICTKLRGMMKVDNERKLKVEAAELAGQAVQGKIDDTTSPAKQDKSLASDGAAVRAATAENVTITPPPVKTERLLKKDITPENFIFLACFIAVFGAIAAKMGGVNMLKTMMNTAFDLLMNVCFYIMAIAVLAGALSGLFSEFGIIAMVNRIVSKIMSPIYDLPGAASLGMLNCFLSDNPAILTLAADDNFLTYFKKYQLPALTNLGTAFGMGLITVTTMMGMDVKKALPASMIGLAGAIVGSVVSVRIMLVFTRKIYGTEAKCELHGGEKIPDNMRQVRPGGVGSRFIQAMLEGGKVGVEMGLCIVPGVVIICTLVTMLTNGAGPNGIYTGEANQGIPVLPWLGEKISFIIKPLFGFTAPEAIAVPITALGSTGAAIGVVAKLVQRGAITANDIAVFSAICMCWSGYISTHIAMCDALNCKELTGKAIFSHTIGGLTAGVAAHLIAMVLL